MNLAYVFVVRAVILTRKTAGSRPVDKIARLTSLNRINTMILEVLNTSGAPRDPPEWTQSPWQEKLLTDFGLILRFR